jgi:beta-glucanase (GH16 family)
MVFDHPFFMLLNVAVGGNWPGSPDGSTQFPQTMTVDYVHIYSWIAGSSGGQITGLAGKCLDVAGAGTANGTAVQLYSCNWTNAQQWTRPGDGTIRALGKCLDVPGGSTANGAKLQIWDCNGTGAQQWRVETAGDIVNVPANKCMDVTDGNSADGTRTQIWDCTGAPNQKWVVA